MHSKKILIIDDNVSVSIVVKLALEYKYDVASTTSALSAFKYLSENKVDLILLDIKMPVINGIEALREIKKKHPETIVIMLSAYASDNNIHQSRTLGAYSFIIKPFDIDELRDCIDSAI